MRYIVYTPTYERGWVDTLSLDPPDYGSDIVEVEATDRKEALIEGLRELRRTRSQWIQDQQSDGRHPFAGLKVEQLGDETNA